jgi:ribose/xylose/arabinose/galactoside ABC-type transport system permease subunit
MSSPLAFVLALRAPLKSPLGGALVALFALVVADAILVPDFLGAPTLAGIALQVAPTVLTALGMTVVIASGGIDLSVGSVMAVSSAVAAMLLPHGVLPAVLAALGVAIVIGAGSGLLVARLGVLPIIATLAVLIIARGVAQVVVSGSPLVTFDSPRFELLGRGRIGAVPVPVVLAGVSVFAVAAVVRATTFGRWVVAVGGNQRAARLAGVPIARAVLMAYVLSAALAGLAGLVVAARLGATDPGTIGQGSELDAIAAAVVGGTALSGGRASIGGSVVGSVLMGMLTATFAMFLVPYAWSLVGKAVILVVAVILERPRAR